MGKSVQPNIAIGKIYIPNHASAPTASTPLRETSDHPTFELSRFTAACTSLEERLSRLSARAAAELGTSSAEVFEAHRMLLKDTEFTETIAQRIMDDQLTAESAIRLSCASWKQQFHSLDSDFFAARGEDIADVCDQLVTILANHPLTGTLPDEPVILAVDALTPSEFLQLDTQRILGLVIRHGSPQSHTAILISAKNIPALFDVDFSSDIDGMVGIIDGETGTLITEPAPDELAVYHQKTKRTEAEAPCPVTGNGLKLRLYANLNHISELPLVLAANADGIGLFRTEFLFLASADFPDEEAQFEVYRTIAETMQGKKVIIRTLDIGSDKQAAYFPFEHEENPALGWRGIRVLLEREDLLRTQLRAIYRASSFGSVAVMFPMITSTSEVDELLSVRDSVLDELTAEGIPFRPIETGLMIETPAAVMISDELADKVDFFSIGTNDLTQYTLAADRQNPRLSRFYDAHHPAILRMIQMVVDHAHKKNCQVGICGELAADTSLTETFLHMGIDELSVSPSMLNKIRNR
jgi:phosphotransferase system enzyme I (PtsI)